MPLLCLHRSLLLVRMLVLERVMRRTRLVGHLVAVAVLVMMLMLVLILMLLLMLVVVAVGVGVGVLLLVVTGRRALSVYRRRRAG